MSDLTSTERAIRAVARQPLTNVSADRGWAQRFQLAAEDVREGARLWRLAWALGLADIKLRYRGSTLGPFWLTISFAIMMGAMGFLYADLFHVDVHKYIPYLTVSILFWNYLNTLVTEGCTCFTQSDALIKGARMPFTVHAARSVIRNTIIMGHNFVVLIGVFLIFDIHISLYTFAFLPALLLWIIDAFAASLLFGVICARFRDVPQIIGSILQIAFFVTPIMWYANILSGHPTAEMLVKLNPFLYLLEIIRAPLLGTPITIDATLGAIAVSVGIIAVSAIGFARSRGRIAYWV